MRYRWRCGAAADTPPDACTTPTTAASTPAGPSVPRLREAGLLASLGSVGDALDNSLAESFFATLQTELLDRRGWTTRGELATAIFEYVECFYNPTRRHSTLDYLSPVGYEHRHTADPPGQAA